MTDLDFTDSIVEDLRAISHIGWSDKKKFKGLQLIRQPLIFETAAEPKEVTQRADALRVHLLNTVTRYERFEEEHEPKFGHRVAYASKALLRLEPEFEGLSLVALREMITEHPEHPWLNPKTRKNVTVHGFRQWVERSQVWVPFIAEFLRYADELAAKGCFDPNAVDPGNLDTAEEAMVRRLRTMEEATFEERMNRIVKDGELKIRYEIEMLDVLQMITDQAKREYRAVDSRPPKEWRTPLMKKFLARQLARVGDGGLSLERIYLVRDGGMEDATFRKNLAWLIKRHEEAKATLLLCPLEAAKELKLSFQPERGFFLADGDGNEALGVTGMLKKGEIGHAVLYTRDNETLRTYIEEYEALAAEIEDSDLDRRLREQLPELLEPDE